MCERQKQREERDDLFKTFCFAAAAAGTSEKHFERSFFFSFFVRA
jgi:hypothetical protein